MDKSTQQPVAYDIIDTDRGYWQTIRADDMKRLKHFLASPGAWDVVPLYTAPPVPREVLMAAMMEVCGWIDANDPCPDLNEIADRYASQVQPERCAKCNTPDLCEEYGNACVDQPEPVNQQMLAALKSLYRGYVSTLETGRDRIVALGGQCDAVDVMERNDPALRDARSAIAAAEKEHGHD